MTGRPSLYTPELADIICARIAEGESLLTVCRDEGMPSYQAIMNWLAKSEAGDEQFAGFVEKYTRSREAQADMYFEECLEIADNIPIKNSDHIQEARVRIDTRKWMAGKLRPKKYGDKLDVTQKTTIEHATKEQRDAAVKAATES